MSCFLVNLDLLLNYFRPVRAYWELEPKYPHTCLNDGAAVFSASVVNIVTDFMATVIPMPLIWNLKLPARQRIAVMSIFGLGVVVNVAGSVRTAYVYKSMLDSYDSTWYGWPILLSAAIEINLGLVCYRFSPQSQLKLTTIDLCLRTSLETALGIRPAPSPSVHPQRLLIQQAGLEALVHRTIQAFERGCLAGADRRGSPRRPSRSSPHRRNGNLVRSNEQDHIRPQHLQRDIESYPRTVKYGEGRFEIWRRHQRTPHLATQQLVGIRRTAITDSKGVLNRNI